MLVFVGVLALAFAFVGSNVAANHRPKPHHVPVGVVGSPQTAGTVAGQLERTAPGGFKVRSYGSAAAAQTAILHRTVFGAFEPGSPPALLIASAASPAVATLLQKTFAAAASAQGQTLRVSDVAPLPQSDSSGATSSSGVLSLIIVGLLGTAAVYLVTQNRPRSLRLAAVVALAIGGGLVAALVTNVVVGAFSGHFLGVWGVATLFVLAIALPIAAFQTLLGLPGTAVGLLVFVVIGNPSSGGGSAPELLPGFWRAISQHLPPGAGTTSMRDVVYFHGHGATNALLVLSVYAVLGAIGTLALPRLRPGAAATTASVANAGQSAAAGGS